ncbi:hypothetical protein BTR14_01625 [Rhizobium rhizosphaerae]|uniref:Integrase n=1 Tax=Xaviernesmea rhizosphaerae TaxID=1672749 RepID=A0ABX3PIA6_9HYPH|nr:hypothetical protein [Xaviernesmea rhizosphaerae]OQP88183.1 hypothetical protein BTR14_01625 [Xaviernesmea rhizosphaerae]
MVEVTDITSPLMERPSKRVADFIGMVRTDIKSLIDNDQWDDDLWATKGEFQVKGRRTKVTYLPFYNRLCIHKSGRYVSGKPMARSFKDFAKAYIRYSHATEPVSFTNTDLRIKALQCVEDGFRKLGITPEIWRLNHSVLAKAVALAAEGIGKGKSSATEKISSFRHYQLAVRIEKIYAFAVARGFLDVPFSWKHGMRKPTDKSQKIGEEARQWRESRLPSVEALQGLAYIFNNAETVKDKLYSSVCAIFVSVPIRAHEVFQLRVDCEVVEHRTDERTGAKTEAYGLRVWPGKGHPPEVKWVPTPMIEVVKTAIARIRNLCDDARSAAACYESSPSRLVLDADVGHLHEREWLSREEFRQLLGHKVTGAQNAFLSTNPDIRRKRIGPNNELSAVNFDDLRKHFLSLLPPQFPHFNNDRDQPFSRTLILMDYSFGRTATNWKVRLPMECTVNQFIDWLAGKGSDGRMSVFERWKLTEKDGSPISTTSHSFRHWLNTVAQLHGMSEIDIALWSGRSLEHNKAYNHVTPEERLSQFRAAYADGKVAGPMFEAARGGRKPPIDRNSLGSAMLGAALLTRFGYCSHDYSMLPCQVHGDCLGCSELVFVKGDEEHVATTREHLAIADLQLEEALAAMDESYIGADRWIARHRQTIERLQLILKHHDDASISDGTIINLRASTSTDNEIAMAIRDRKRSPEGAVKPRGIPTSPRAFLDEIRES